MEGYTVMSVIPLTESKPKDLKLTDFQYLELVKMGRSLASKSSWWGNEERHLGTGENRSIISCIPKENNIYTVSVRNAVGVISIPGIDIEVIPKINENHFMYFLERSICTQRTTFQASRFQRDFKLWDLLAYWFLEKSSEVIRQGLIQEYKTIKEEIPYIKGQIDFIRSVRNIYTGNMNFGCEYEEYQYDHPFNRVLKQATLLVGSSPLFNQGNRKQAMRQVNLLNGVGQFIASDLDQPFDRITLYYEEAILLAELLIKGAGIYPKLGLSSGWAFLIPTPNIIEKAILVILQDYFGQRVKKQGRRIEKTSWTLNPDIIIDNGDYIGDVKYKINSENWLRPDLYEIITFAEGFNATRAFMVDFCTGQMEFLPTIKVGKIIVNNFRWKAVHSVSPVDSRNEFLMNIETWLNT